MEHLEEQFDTKAGIVAVVGKTNVGKSTLINHMLGEKVSIVSDTVQTTRNMVRAILTEPRGQMVFMDTPGVHKAEGTLGQNLNKLARKSVEGVDAVLFVVDAAWRPMLEDDGWIRRLIFSEAPVIVWLNKADIHSEYAERFKELHHEICEEKGVQKDFIWMSGSALNGDNVPELMVELFKHMPEGPLLFPEDVLTDYPKKLNIGDVIREKLFYRLTDEVPHCVAVWVDKIHELDGKWKVEATIYVERHSQKGIVIGDKGRLIKWVRQQAERELKQMYGFPVKLDLWVKVEKNWRQNFWILKKLGYA
ncbi:GTPase Era [Verrucomicrobiota bacterium]